MRDRERKFTRPSKKQVKESAEKGQTSAGSFLRLPEGVEKWVPAKKGTVDINIVPYITTSNNHPDDVKAGTLWYKRGFAVHRNVGVERAWLVCPRSVGKKCPICEHKDVLAQDWKANEVQIRAISPQKWVMFNILNPEDPESISIFCMSKGKFADFLEQEVTSQSDDSNYLFFDLNEDGRTLRTRFSSDSYEGRKFLQATRIDFLEREPLDEDILSKVMNLDEILIVESYEKIKNAFDQSAEDEVEAVDDADGDDDEVEVVPAKKSKPKAKPVEIEDDDDDDDDEPEPPAKKVKPKSKPKVEEDDGDDDDDDGSGVDLELLDDDDEPELPKKTKSKAKPVEIEDDDDDDDDEPEPPAKKSTKKSKAKPIDDDDDDE